MASRTPTMLLLRSLPCKSGSRCFSTTKTRWISLAPVTLAHDLYPAPSSSDPSQGPLVILHGLFGSKQNWRSLSKALAQKLGRSVYTLDLRNHGDSPHSEGTTYRHYAQDVSAFLSSNKLMDPILMGHSMGGKVAMTQALAEPDSISKLIVVDISPAKGAISPEFANYIVGMREVDQANVNSKKEGDKILQSYEESLPIRQFLLTNLTKEKDSPKYSVRLPLDILSDSIDNIGDFPFDPKDGARFDKPVLFIKGGDSKYINRKNVGVAEELFPQMRLEVIDGVGHWVHSEKPKQFIDTVDEFCK